MRTEISALQEAKAQLAERREALRHRLDAIRANLARTAAPANVDPVELPEALEVSTQSELRKVDNALERLSSGKYGECARCGYAIEPPRLRALPQTTCCAECA
jgi:RNA polymerase-binding transcription factor DksA